MTLICFSIITFPLWSEPVFDSHVRAFSRKCPYHTRKAANAKAVILIPSKLDYCNSLLHDGLPSTQINCLQAVQNAAAGVMSKSRKRDHIEPNLRGLHRLPVADRIQHKVFSTVCQSLRGSPPLYLSKLIPTYSMTRSLRPVTKSLLVFPNPKDSNTKHLRGRTFRSYEPANWNNLPDNIKNCDMLPTSQKKKN